MAKKNKSRPGTIELTPAKREEQQKKKVQRALEKYDRRLKRKSEGEFNKWKSMIKGMIDKDATMTLDADGVASFALPDQLVRLVWLVVIKDRLMLEMKRGGVEGAAKRTIDFLHQQVTQEVANTQASMTIMQAAEEEKARFSDPAVHRKIDARTHEMLKNPLDVVAKAQKLVEQAKEKQDAQGEQSGVAPTDGNSPDESAGEPSNGETVLDDQGLDSLR